MRITIQLICTFISLVFYAQEREIKELELTNKRTPLKVIELVENKFSSNYIKQDTLTFYAKFSNKEEKLGEIYHLEGNLDLFFDDYLDENNHVTDSFIYEDTKYINNRKILDRKKEHYLTYFRDYLAPNIVYKIIRKKKQYYFSFLEVDDESIYQIRFLPKRAKSSMYEGFLTIDKKTFAILDFQTKLIEHKGNHFRTMLGSRNDSYNILSHQLSCSFEKGKNDFYQIKECNTEAKIHQNGNYHRKYEIIGNIKKIETPIRDSKEIFATSSF